MKLFIVELERRRRNVSFDSEIVVDKPAEQLNLDNFADIFKEKTGETINAQVLKKLELTKELNGVVYPTNALVLFSDDELPVTQCPIMQKWNVQGLKVQGRKSLSTKWGNGLKLIFDELKTYPQIGFQWKEVGLSFQVQFVKLDYVAKQELGQELAEQTMYSLIFEKLTVESMSRQDLAVAFLISKKFPVILIGR